MKLLPDSLMNSLVDAKGFDREAFERIHTSGEQVTSIRVNPSRFGVETFLQDGITGIAVSESNPVQQIPWTQYGFYLPERPSFTFDPMFHAGCYYVQEASSMFLEQALKQWLDLSKPLRLLDLSAAPGGKSTHIQSLISSDSLLVSNEVIRSRAFVLKDNIIKWGAANVVVTNNDPKDFNGIEGYFDAIIVDAPCSGSGLFRRDPAAIDEWSPANVALCSQRQQRILADIWPALKKDGLLIYATCSYSPEEDEDIVNWLIQEYNASLLPLNIDAEWGIVSSGEGYRFWPYKLKGEGFFLACLQKTSGEEQSLPKTKVKANAATKKDIELIHQWVKPGNMEFIKHNNTVYAWPKQLVAENNFLLKELKVIYSGILAGELARDKMVPDHALAMSKIVMGEVPSMDLDYEQAIKYLQKKDFQAMPASKGWQLMRYNGYTLGWANVLANRINNYYPKELRILKDS
jgi:16S rRNA C967 or C1407 C5-methylase (RsmB/RsmF family)/NOL1/NOP2/fmu family ribosome biogenesis protein